MTDRAKYLLILIFFAVVFSALFFIYLAINSPAEIIYFSKQPSILEKIKCIAGAGRLEVEYSGGGDGVTCPKDSVNEYCSEEIIFSCVYK